MMDHQRATSRPTPLQASVDATSVAWLIERPGALVVAGDAGELRIEPRRLVWDTADGGGALPLTHVGRLEIALPTHRPGPVRLWGPLLALAPGAVRRSARIEVEVGDRDGGFGLDLGTPARPVSRDEALAAEVGFRVLQEQGLLHRIGDADCLLAFLTRAGEVLEPWTPELRHGQVRRAADVIFGTTQG